LDTHPVKTTGKSARIILVTVLVVLPRMLLRRGASNAIDFVDVELVWVEVVAAPIVRLDMLNAPAVRLRHRPKLQGFPSASNDRLMTAFILAEYTRSHQRTHPA